MDREDANIAKRELCEKLLTPGTVMVVIDTRRDGVVVPTHLAGDPKLRLNIDYRFGAAMTVDDHGIHATLSFGGVEFDCELPWESIYVLMPHTSSQPYVFPDDVPNEVLDEIGIETKSADHPALRLVTTQDTEAVATPQPAPTTDEPEQTPGELSQEAEPNPPPTEPPPPSKRRGHLRVVK